MRRVAAPALLLVCVLIPARLESRSPAPRPPACDSAEYRQSDFWLGNWEVRAPDGRYLGTDSVSKILRGCVVILASGTGSKGDMSLQVEASVFEASQDRVRTWKNLYDGHYRRQ